MQHIELTVKGLSYSQGKSGAYALILAETGEGGRKLPVVIGGAEAQSIAVAMEKSVAPPRPLTHDTWKNMLDELGVTLEKIVIHRLVNGVFYASLYTVDSSGGAHVFDSRPSVSEISFDFGNSISEESLLEILNNCIPPTFIIGIKVIAITIIPIPPNH